MQGQEQEQERPTMCRGSWTSSEKPMLEQLADLMLVLLIA